MNHCQEIYLAAKKRDRDAILKLQAAGLSVDQCLLNNWPLTAAGKLAEEGDKDSAEFLRHLGANIHWIAYGAGRGGKKVQVYAELLRRLGADVDWIARGATKKGKLSYAKFLLKNHNADPDILAGAAVKRGKVNWAENFRHHIPMSYHLALYEASKKSDYTYINHILSSTPTRNVEDLAMHAWMGMMWTKNKTSVLNLLLSIFSKRPHLAIPLPQMIGELAKEGYFDKENIYLDHRISIPIPKKSWDQVMLEIAINSALGGHIEFAEKCRLEYQLSKDKIIQAAAAGGHFQYAEQLSSDNPNQYKEKIILGALEFHHYAYLWRYIKNNKGSIVDVIKCIETLDQNWDVNTIIKRLLKIESREFKETILIEGAKLNKFDAKVFEYVLETSETYHKELKQMPRPLPWGYAEMAFFQANHDAELESGPIPYPIVNSKSF